MHEKWYLNGLLSLLASFVSPVPLSTAALNFSCVPRLRAASAAVSFAWPSSLVAALEMLAMLFIYFRIQNVYNTTTKSIQKVYKMVEPTLRYIYFLYTF